MIYVFGLYETFEYHSNLLHVSRRKFHQIKTLQKTIFTSILSIELVGGSQLNSSRIFLNVAFILSPHDYIDIRNKLNEILVVYIEYELFLEKLKRI